MQKSLVFLFVLFTFSSNLFAQDAELKPPKPDFTFGANLILSNPLSDFGDTDVLNADAGFAQFGAGLGIFGHFEYKNGFFVEINADYTRRKSTVWSESVDILAEIINEQDPTQEIEFSVLRNPGFRHLSFLFGPGFNFKMKDVDIYLRGEFGLAFNRLTSSSIEDNNGRTRNFDASGEIVPAFGLGAGALIYDIVRFDFSFMNLGNPEFRLSRSETSNEFSLPIQVFELGVGIMIVR